MRQISGLTLLVSVLAVGAAPALQAQKATGTPPPSSAAAPVAQPPAPRPAAPTPAPAPAAVVTPPMTAPDYVVGTGDVLAVVFWREQDMSAEVVVRPDGRISIPLLNDIEVAGLTPDQLRQKLTTEAQKYVQDPNVTVVVKQINSRRVFITGQVAKPGPYSLTTQMNVLQLISTAGGLLEYADDKNILIMRNENGRPTNYPFNYKDVIKRRNLKQNIDLKPGDTVIVP